MAEPSWKPHPWQPLPWQAKPLDDTSPVVLFTGSAGGGKSRLWQEMVHRYCVQYPGALFLLARKTRESWTRIVEIEIEPIVRLYADHFPSHSVFKYHNGSQIYYVGLNNQKERLRIRSLNADGFVMEEGTEFVESPISTSYAPGCVARLATTDR